MKTWTVTAYTDETKRVRFASCEVLAETRAEATQKAIDRDIISDSSLWTAGVGHIMTARRTK